MRSLSIILADARLILTLKQTSTVLIGKVLENARFSHTSELGALYFTGLFNGREVEIATKLDDFPLPAGRLPYLGRIYLMPEKGNHSAFILVYLKDNGTNNVQFEVVSVWDIPHDDEDFVEQFINALENALKTTEYPE